MSQENVEIARESFAAFNRREFDAFLVSLHPDVEWDDSNGFPGVQGVYHGRAGLALEWRGIGEATMLVQQSVRSGKLRPRLKTGYGSVRTVEVLPPVRDDLLEWKRTTGAEGILFPRRSDGQPWLPTDWNNWRRRHFGPAARACGFPDGFRPYDLRHSCASILIAAGRPITEVAAQLGHSPAVSARTYQHLIEEARGKPIRPAEEWVYEARQAASKSI